MANLTTTECLARMKQLSETFLTERAAYGAARIEWHKKHEQVLRIIQSGAFEYLKNEVARKILKTVIDDNRLGKMTIADKDAIAKLEHAELFDVYDTAKFNSETSEKAFKMFSDTLIGTIGEAKLEQKSVGFSA